MTRTTMRILCVILMVTPVFLVWAASLVVSARGDLPVAERLPMAGRVFPFVAAYFLAAPFLVDLAFSRSRGRIIARGKDPDQVVLLVGVASSNCATMVAFLFFALVGGPAGRVYWCAPLSVVAGAYWCWRYHRVFA